MREKEKFRERETKLQFLTVLYYIMYNGSQIISFLHEFYCVYHLEHGKNIQNLTVHIHTNTKIGIIQDDPVILCYIAYV